LCKRGLEYSYPEAIEANLLLILAPHRSNPVTAIPPSYYLEYSKGETRLFGSPKNAEETG